MCRLATQFLSLGLVMAVFFTPVDKGRTRKTTE